MKQVYVWLAVALIILGSVAAVASVYLWPRPCSLPGAPPELPGDNNCPPPAPIPPTTVIPSGTVFTVDEGQYDYFQFQPSLSSFATLTGSFTTSHGAAVLVMLPSDFANFSEAPTTFQCLDTEDACFTTGQVAAGSVNVSFLPVYQQYEGGQSVVAPWFLVMQSSNSSSDTNVTWVTSLVANYMELTAPTTAFPAAVARAGQNGLARERKSRSASPNRLPAA